MEDKESEAKISHKDAAFWVVTSCNDMSEHYRSYEPPSGPK